MLAECVSLTSSDKEQTRVRAERQKSRKAGQDQAGDSEETDPRKWPIVTQISSFILLTILNTVDVIRDRDELTFICCLKIKSNIEY